MFPRTDNLLAAQSAGEPGADVFPYVFTTYRLTEHHTAGGMSRWLPYLSELQPEMFCEVSPELAAERGLEHGGWATIVTARTAIEARVLVTERMPPLRVGGRIVHQIGLPYHWGAQRARPPATPPTTWLAVTLDPNVHIQESKAAHLRHPARPPAARARDLLRRTSRSTGARAGDRPTSTGDGAMTMARTRSGQLADRPTPPPTPAGTTTTRRGWASSPTPRSASAARPARWPARSGTRVPDGRPRRCTGMSYDNTGGAGREHLAARRVHRADRAVAPTGLGLRHAGRPRHAGGAGDAGDARPSSAG